MAETDWGWGVLDYRWNHARLRAIAYQQFDIWHDIHVERRRRRYDRRTGFYSVDHRYKGWAGWCAGEHQVVVVSNLDARDALQVLAHELRHCWQRERYEGNGFSKAYARYPDGFEDDADDFAERRWHELKPIVTIRQES